MRAESIAHADIPELVEMARAAHAESKYSHIPFSERAAKETFERHIDYGFAVMCASTKIAGFFLAETGGFVFSEIPICVETTYYVRPEFRGSRCFYLLMSAFKGWAADRPQILMPHFGKDNSKIFSALEKLGFNEAGRIYTRGI
jgi:GNAT superfamily N-acetyltransferase